MEPVWVAFVTALISSVIGAIVSAIVMKIKMTKQAIEDAREERNKDNAELKDLMLQNTKLTCRLAIYDEHFSTDEKLSAYKIYSSHGWNHQTKTYMDELVGGDVDEYLQRHDIRG